MITAQLATFPARIAIVPQVIKSLLPQVDRLNVMLNGYDLRQLEQLCRAVDTVPMYNLNSVETKLENPKMVFYLQDNSMTDAAKYLNIEKAEGYIFTCDDDILYPADYVQKTIEAIEKYERKYVITYHGRVWRGFPIKNFYTDRKDKGLPIEGMYRCIQGFEGDHFVDCGGDGVMAWHSDTFKMRYDYCEHKNMSQLWIALKCNNDRVKQMAIGHPEGWLLDLTVPGTEDDCIWAWENENCRLQTKLINERWKV